MDTASILKWLGQGRLVCQYSLPKLGMPGVLDDSVQKDDGWSIARLAEIDATPPSVELSPSITMAAEFETCSQGRTKRPPSSWMPLERATV